MKALIQRVSRAAVMVEGKVVGEIGQGLLVLLGVERGDDDVGAGKMAAKLCGYRVFADSDKKMNLSVSDVKGSILLVSQFTLAANTDKGLRPSFSRAAEPAEAERLYLLVAEKIREQNICAATGQFAANMQVELVNDGPVTFLLQE